MSVDGEETMSEHEGDSGVESTNSADSMMYIRIAVPDLNIQVGLRYVLDVVIKYRSFVWYDMGMV